jgi:hypothetical protein
MRLFEFYQEEPGGAFTHDGVEYLLNPLFKFTENYPVVNLDVDKLSWIITDPDEESDYADISVPVIVTEWHNKLVVIDGYHRLLKSVKLHKNTIPAKIVSDRLLSYFKKK